MIQRLLLLICWFPIMVFGQVSMTTDASQGPASQRIKLTLLAEQRQDVKQPDFSVLEKDFDVQSQSKYSSASFKSGYTVYTNRWILNLLPKSQGELTIPGIMVGSERSRPLTYTVLEAAALPPPPAVRIEVSLDPEVGYARSALTLSTQVFYAVDLASAELQEPVIEDALLVRLGQQSHFPAKYRDVDYQVIEQRYLLFPLQARDYRLPSLEFVGSDSQGSKYSARSRPLVFDAIEPANNPWLAASELRIEDQWLSPLDNLQVGDTVTRQITIEAHSVPAAWLPEILMPSVEGISIHGREVSQDEDSSTGTLVSRKTFTYNLLLTRAGPHRLPELEIPWWDIVRDQAEQSTLAAKELLIKDFISAEPPRPETIMTATPEISLSQKDQDKTHSGNSWMAWLWAFIAIICAMGWSLTYTRLKLAQKTMRVQPQEAATTEQAPAPEVDDPQLEETALYNQLARACSRNQAADARRLLTPWAQALWPSVEITDLHDVEFNSRDATLRYLLKDLEYNILHPDESDPWQGDLLLRQLQKIRHKQQLQASNQWAKDDSSVG